MDKKELDSLDKNLKYAMNDVIDAIGLSYDFVCLNRHMIDGRFQQYSKAIEIASMVMEQKRYLEQHDHGRVRSDKK